MNVSEILNKAADLIEPEGAHLKYDLAKDAKGKPVHPESKYAVCWCAAGAIYAVEGTPSKSRLEVDDLIPGGCLVQFNNDHTQAEVVAALRAAAERAAQ